MTNKILDAVKQLDAKNDNHWTADGLPRLETVRMLASDTSLSREQVNDAAKDYNRAAAIAAVSEPPAPPPVQPGSVPVAPTPTAGSPPAGAEAPPLDSGVRGELGPETARERARQRLQAFLAAERERRLAPLVKLEQAMAAGQVKGLPRGIGHRLVEAGGLLDRRAVEADLKALSQAERRSLRMLGVRIGAFSLLMPGLLEPPALAFAQAMVGGSWRPPINQLSRLPSPAPPARALAARGLRAVGAFAVPAAQLEQLDDLLRAGFRPGIGIVLTDQARETLGWSAAETAAILRALNFTPSTRTEPIAWRRRNEKPAEQVAPSPPPNSPFAALAGLKVAPQRRRPKRRKPAAS